MKNTFLIMLSFLSIALTTSCKKAAGDKAVVSEAAEVKASMGTSLAVDLAGSSINWEGAKPTGSHTGTIKLSGGEVKMDGRQLTGGSFTLDMNSINVTDLEGGKKAGLEAHLKGTAEGKEDHFFNVPQHPTGQFDITKVVKLDGDETATHMIYGNLTLKGMTKEIGFKALVGIGDGRIEVTTPAFTIDRTQWGVNYNSKSVFSDLGDNFVNDEIGLSITLKAGKAMI